MMMMTATAARRVREVERLAALQVAVCDVT